MILPVRKLRHREADFISQQIMGTTSAMDLCFPSPSVFCSEKFLSNRKFERIVSIYSSSYSPIVNICHIYFISLYIHFLNYLKINCKQYDNSLFNSSCLPLISQMPFIASCLPLPHPYL